MKLSMVFLWLVFLIRQEKDIRKPWKGFLKNTCHYWYSMILNALETDFGATLIISLTAHGYAICCWVLFKATLNCNIWLICLVGIFIYLNPNRIARLTSFWVDDFWVSNDPKVHQTTASLNWYCQRRLGLELE